MLAVWWWLNTPNYLAVLVVIDKERNSRGIYNCYPRYEKGLITQTVMYVDEVEVVDTLDCQSRDSGFKPRRQRQPDTDAFIAS